MISPESLSVLFPNHRYGSGIQDDEDRSWSGDDACDEARAGDEVDRAGGCSASFGYFRIFNLDFTLLQFDLGFFFCCFAILICGAKVKADEDVPQRVDIISLRRDLALLLLRVPEAYDRPLFSGIDITSF
ncbi:hypothetical protein DVH24_027995 [Malus domestica]|uniref:Uncharacterized protein n=1 Tax=Malus domestica TaxID=3750 RepID=A0A498H8V8_MALDO|nr:hypothetical protein DVH24_027995 [Malus domestica]